MPRWFWKTQGWFAVVAGVGVLFLGFTGLARQGSPWSMGWIIALVGLLCLAEAKRSPP